jgi:hypothetical protein
MFLTFDVKPWYRNVGKPLVKSPKGYLIATCLICYLPDYSIDDIAIKKTGVIRSPGRKFCGNRTFKATQQY